MLYVLPILIAASCPSWPENGRPEQAAVEQVITSIRQGTDHERIESLQQLQRASQAIRTELTAIVVNPDDPVDVRIAALGSLAEVDPILLSCREQMKQILADVSEPETLRLNVLMHLFRGISAESLDADFELLSQIARNQSDSIEVRYAAAGYLSQHPLTAGRASPLLMSFLRNPKEHLRLRQLAALTSPCALLVSPRRIRKLMPVLAHVACDSAEDRELREQALESLSTIPGCWLKPNEDELAKSTMKILPALRELEVNSREPESLRVEAKETADFLEERLRAG